MDLLTSSDGFQIDINPYLWTLQAFAELLEDRKNDKPLLLKELGYMYFFTNPKSDFQLSTDLVDRDADVRKYINMPSSWKQDDLFNEAHEVYIGRVTNTESKLLEGARIASDKIDTQLRAIDLAAVDKSGKPIHNLKMIQDCINRVPDTMAALDKAKKVYINSQKDDDNIRKGIAKGAYD